MVALAAIVWGAVYLGWRLIVTGKGADPALFVILLACEVFGWLMLTSFAFLAWPAEYENSGIVSFIVGQDGIVYQKDLGPNTANVAGKISRFDPVPSWTRVDIKD